MKIRSKLLLGNILVFIIVFILWSMHYYVSRNAEWHRKNIELLNDELNILTEIYININRQLKEVTDYMLTKDEEQHDEFIEYRNKVYDYFSKWELLISNYKLKNDYISDLYHINILKNKYTDINTKVSKILKKNNYNNSDIEHVTNIIEDSYEKDLVLDIEKNFNLIRESMIKLDQKERSELEFINLLSLVLIFISILLIIIMFWYLSYSISRPINTLTNIADKIGQGKFDTKLVLNTKDEFYILNKAFNKMSHDIKTTQSDLKLSNEYISNVIVSIVDMLITIDIDFTIKSINKVALDTLGYAKNEIIGSPLSIILKNHNNIFNNNIFNNNNFIKNLKNNPIKGIETNYISKTGQNITVNMSCSALINTNDEVYGIVCIARDVRDIRQLVQQKEEAVIKAQEINQLYNELKDTQGQLLQSQKMESLGQLAGGVAHDFNNLLGAIIGFTDILLAKFKDDVKTNHYLENIMKSSCRAKDLVQKLLNASYKNVSINKTVFSINKSIQDTISILDRTIDKKIHIETNFDTNNLNIEADEQQISQVFINLALNAKDAMPNGGLLSFITDSISLSSHNNHNLAAGEYVRIKISDTGIGMPEKIQQHIFDPFFTTKEVGKGTGLGLSMVYNIILEHGGIIDVSSKINKGTIFQILLPKTNKELYLSNNNNNNNNNINLDYLSNLKENYTILVVDDEPVMRELVQEILDKKNIKLYFAENGQEGIDIYKKHKNNIDLVILDLVMPKLDGFEVFKILREDNPKLKVILSSGYAETEKVKNIKKNKDIKYVQKPYTSNILLQNVEEFLNSASS